MDKKDVVKVVGQVLTIAAGVTAGLMIHAWLTPAVAKMSSSKPLETTQE